MEERCNVHLTEDVMERIFQRRELADVMSVRAVSRRWRELFPSLVSAKWAHYSPCFIHLAAGVSAGHHEDLPCFIQLAARESAEQHNRSSILVAFNKITKIWERFPLHSYISKDWGKVVEVSGARMKGPILVEVYGVADNSKQVTQVVCVSNVFTRDGLVLPAFEEIKPTFKLKDFHYTFKLEDILFSFDSQGFTVSLICRNFCWGRFGFVSEWFEEFEFQSLTSLWNIKIYPSTYGGWKRSDTARALGKDGNIFSLRDFGRVLFIDTPRSEGERGRERIADLDRLESVERSYEVLVMANGRLMAVTIDLAGTQNNELGMHMYLCVYEVNEQTKQARKVSCENKTGEFAAALHNDLFDDTSRRRSSGSSDGHSIFLWLNTEVDYKHQGVLLIYCIQEKKWTELAVDSESRANHSEMKLVLGTSHSSSLDNFSLLSRKEGKRKEGKPQRAFMPSQML